MGTEQLKRRGYEVRYDPYSHRGQWYISDSYDRRVTETYKTEASAWRAARKALTKELH